MGLLLVLLPATAIGATWELPPAQHVPTGVELLAFEAPGCRYCPVFRRDVAPSYAVSRAGMTAPLRYIDINDASASSLKLASPVTVVPTLVLVRDGVEIGRIPGYVGRENTHRILDSMLPR
jgi:thioredoxin-related protein